MNNTALSFKKLKKCYESDSNSNKVTELCYGYRSTEWRYGDIVSIYSESGTGKSTLINLLSGLTSPSEGEIEFHFPDGGTIDWCRQNFFSEEAYLVRTHLGVVFQEALLFPQLTGLENIMLEDFFSSGDVRSTKKIDFYIKYLGLDKLINKYPKIFSGGERRRFACLQALLKSPNIIFADEPTTGLDSGNGNLIMETLKAWIGENKKERMLVLVTHDEEIRKNYATRHFKLTENKIQETVD